MLTAGGGDSTRAREALASLCQTYWFPLYAYVRRRGYSAADAEDLTQGFFAEAIDKNFFGRYDASRARFRTFLRTCLDGFVANENKAANRVKRGGNATILSLDFDGAEEQLKTLEWELARLKRALVELTGEPEFTPAIEEVLVS